ncbi:hypothetical protein [Chryseobacterium jejuense]|uniref:hypothetical protein n=1 Tax=Chryseobacterium jejuense TaxID=445960 RepID=UPI001AE3D85F|nr:hypothetical protein [Chryseobacterium jejuense]
MKLYNLIILFILIFHSCDGQKNNITYPKEKIVNTETFDISSYEKLKDEQLTKNMLNPWTVETKLATGEKQELFSSADGNEITYFKSITPQEPALLKTIKRFYSNGKIAVEYETYVGILNPYPNAKYTLVGETKYYDKGGVLEKIENNEKIFENKKVNLPKLFSLLEKEPILDNLSSEEQKKLKELFFEEKNIDEITPRLLIQFFQENLKKENPENQYTLNGFFLNKNDRNDRESLEISYTDPKWIIKKDFYPVGWVTVEVNAQTGVVSNKKYHFENRP